MTWNSQCMFLSLDFLQQSSKPATSTDPKNAPAAALGNTAQQSAAYNFPDHQIWD